MSELRARLGSEYQLVDFERRLQGSDAVNVVNSRYVQEPLPGWTVRHEIISERATLLGRDVPTMRVVMHFYEGDNPKAAIVLSYVHGLLDANWELHARIGSDGVLSVSHAR